MRIGALIPCRTGSKGIPRKNFKDMAGKPLWTWSYEAAVDSHVFDEIIVSSDGGLPLNGHVGMTYFDNECDPVLQGDFALIDPLEVQYAKMFPNIEAWALLQPTSPLRTAQDIRIAVAMIETHDSVVSVESVGDKYWHKKGDFYRPLYDYRVRMLRQNPKTNVLFYENGAIYVTRTWVLTDTDCRIGGNIGFYEMPQDRSHQVDSVFDWDFCEALMFLKRKAVNAA